MFIGDKINLEPVNCKVNTILVHNELNCNIGYFVFIVLFTAFHGYQKYKNTKNISLLLAFDIELNLIFLLLHEIIALYL